MFIIEKVVLEENIKKSQTEITNLQDKLKTNEEEKGKLNELLKKFQEEVVELKKNSNYTPTSESQQLDEKIKEEVLFKLNYWKYIFKLYDIKIT